MRIAINTLLLKRKPHGVGNYIKNLVWSLSRMDSTDEYLLLASRENLCHFEALPSNFEIHLAPSHPAQRILWEQTVLPLQLLRNKIDLYHGPAFVVPFAKTCLRVVTIHDASFRLTPERHSHQRRFYYRGIVPLIMKASDGIITVSRSAKSDLLDIAAVPEDKVSVIPLGVDPHFQPVTAPHILERIRRKYSLPRDFILFVGMIEPRKNLETLLDAYLAYSLAARFDLVLAGSFGWGYSHLLRKIAASGAADRVRLPGYVEEADLPALYSAAAVFAYPSFYEGFGLPVLEAMACGTAVVTSSVSSLPEVAGTAALLADPHDSGALASALRCILSNATLRADLSRRGLERARSFSWIRTAEKTLALYRRIAEGQPQPKHLHHAPHTAQGSL
jgi:glycosyltransferase involved in cell wall biosynthesis